MQRIEDPALAAVTELKIETSESDHNAIGGKLLPLSVT